MSATAVVCPKCAKTLRSSKALAPGVSVRCPGCQHAFAIPSPEDEVVDVEIVDEESPRPARRISTGLRGTENLRSRRRDDDDDDDEREVRSRRRRDDDGDEDDDPPPRKRRVRDNDDDEFADEPKRKRRLLADVEDDLDDEESLERRPKKKKKKSKRASESGFGSSGAGILGGLAMMAIAVVWFVVGLMNDYIFFYPPILFIIGIAAVIKGAVSK